MNHLIIWKEMVLFLGINQRKVRSHQHPVIQLIAGMHQPFKTKISGKWTEKSGLLFSPNHTHECDATGLLVLTVNIDPESNLGESILFDLLNNQSSIDFPKQQIPSAEKLEWLIHEHQWDELHNQVSHLFGAHKNAPTSGVGKKDERITTVLNHIHTHIRTRPEVRDLCEVAFLSESRLMHLFKQEMGIPIRNYILWYRLKLAFQSIHNGSNLTKAAYEAGFADSAHLSRTCVKTFGLPPGSILKNSRIVQVYHPD